MTPNKEHILRIAHDNAWSGSELARRMGLSRSEVSRFLNGKRVGGKKLMTGIVKAFPEESLEKLFILP